MVNMKVAVKDGNVQKALHALKKRCKREDLMKEVKRQEFYVRPGIARLSKHAKAVRRQRREEAKTS